MGNAYAISSHNLYPPPPSLPCPVISVIIPMYNAEEYISECLESILNQTFQSFEVIVVDDCSTDLSCEIVESYIPIFNGRLRLAHTEVNSGGGGYVPRNVGLKLAGGEYVYFMDADDFILLTALETLYDAAKQYDADVVYCSAYYDMTNLNYAYLRRDGEGKKLFKDGIEDKPTLFVDDPEKNLHTLLLKEGEGNFRSPWTKFLRRNLLIENNIVFPQTKNGGDFIWVIEVYCHSKRFLRLPKPLYFYRRYNTKSVTQTKKGSSEQITHWISGFVIWLKSLDMLANKNEILSENPAYCLSALKSYFEWFFRCVKESREQLSEEEIYKTLRRKFAKDPSCSLMLSLLTLIDTERKIGDERLQTINSLRKEVSQFKDSTVCPAVSVIIALYNAEKYVGECLDSLLNQTFKNFEVIVVDDCSTDNSVKVVESYAPKFNGRLYLLHTEKNSGGCAVPRNKALTHSCGEYFKFLDADDLLTKTALEEMYKLAKKYDADVVDCEKHYHMEEDGTNLRIVNLQREGLVDKPTFETENLAKRIEKILKSLFIVSSCSKFVRRKVMLEHEIFLPNICPSEDDIWTYSLVFHAKRFLRVPNAIYIRRLSKNSIMRTIRTPQQQINFWLNPLLLGLKSLDNLMSKIDFFIQNPQSRYAVLNKFATVKLSNSLKNNELVSSEETYESIKDEFGAKLGEYDVLISTLCTIIFAERKIIHDKFKPYITARIDVKLTVEGNFQILNVSDGRATVSKPAWFQKGGPGYVITSYAGKLEFTAKAEVTGQMYVRLRGLDIREPEDRSKKIPYWIDYTKLVINEQAIFDTVTPVWHDKAYRYETKVKAGEEVTVSVEWLPHRSDT